MPEGACGWWALNFYDVQLTNAEWLKQLLAYPELKLKRSFNAFRILSRMLGTSLLAAEGETWQRMHRILYKAFSPANLEKFVPIFVKQAQRLSEQLEAAAATRTSLDMLQMFNTLTLDVIIEAGFGEALGEADRKVVLDSFRFAMAETQNPLHDIPVLRSLPFPSNLRVDRAFARLQQTADKAVALRRREHEAGSLRNTHEGRYMIDLLLEAKDAEDQLTDVELRDNIIMLMVAGSETTGTCLTWTLWHVVNNPPVLHKVLAEVDALELSWEGVPAGNLDKSMPYLTSVIRETLRLTPAISGIPERIFAEQTTIGDLQLPPGSRVGAAQYVVHRNPDYWTDPDTFDPDRFSEENSKRHTPYSYLPFGLGRRTCMGKQFGMNEMRVVLALLFKYYDFQYDIKAGPVRMLWRPPTIVPRNGLPMFVTRRK